MGVALEGALTLLWMDWGGVICCGGSSTFAFLLSFWGIGLGALSLGTAFRMALRISSHFLRVMSYRVASKPLWTMLAVVGTPQVAWMASTADKSSSLDNPLKSKATAFPEWSVPTSDMSSDVVDVELFFRTSVAHRPCFTVSR